MSKGWFWLAGAVGVFWLFSQDGDSPATGGRRLDTGASYGSPYTAASPAALPGRYGAQSGGDADDGDAEEAEERTEEVRQAKQEFEDAADELRSAVNALRYNRWDGQMSTIRSRLEDADDALSQLESLRPGDPAVQNARDEVDSMRSHMSRLHFENWRSVRPDLDTTSSSIEDEAAAVSDEEEED